MQEQNNQAVAVEVNHNQLNKLIKHNYRANQPIMLWGATGIGKSQVVKETAEEINQEEFNREAVFWNETSQEQKQDIIENPADYFVIWDIRLTQVQPDQIKGLPDLNDGDTVTYKPPQWVKAASQNQIAGFLFLDEVNLAPPSIQAAFYQLILDKQVGELSLSDQVYPIGAGNRAKDQANTYEMGGPLRNRFNHVQLEIPAAGKTEQGFGSLIDYLQETEADSRIIGFLASPIGSSYNHTFQDNPDSKTFATPRKWEELSKLIKPLDTETQLDQIKTLTASSVGRGIATEFISFLDVRNEVDMEGYLENPEKVREIQEKEQSLKHSIMTGLASKYKEDKEILPELVEISTYLDEEYGILLLRLAKNYDEEHFKNQVPETEHFSEVTDKISKYLIN